MYSIHNEEKFVVAQRFIRTLKTKVYKYMTSKSKNVYIDKIDDIINKYNNAYHSTIKKKPVHIEIDAYIDFKNDFNDVEHKFKVGDHVRISKYNNAFVKGYMPNWSEEVFVVNEVKNTVPYVINDINGEEIIGTFNEQELQKTNQQEFRIEKVLKRKGDKLYVKWKSYDSSFNKKVLV